MQETRWSGHLPSIKRERAPLSARFRATFCLVCDSYVCVSFLGNPNSWVIFHNYFSMKGSLHYAQLLKGACFDMTISELYPCVNRQMKIIRIWWLYTCMHCNSWLPEGQPEKNDSRTTYAEWEYQLHCLAPCRMHSGLMHLFTNFRRASAQKHWLKSMSQESTQPLAPTSFWKCFLYACKSWPNLLHIQSYFHA